MRTPYSALILASHSLEQVETALNGGYQVEYCDAAEAALQHRELAQVRMILIDIASFGAVGSVEACKHIKEAEQGADIPVVLMGAGASLDSRMDAYEAGCDDYVTDTDMQELRARVDRVMFNKVASDQLKVQLKQANEMAFIAMSDTSDLGVNIQFLLDVNNCDNLDELGMRLFQALKNYGLNCSLQMRGRYAVKNMEANGMAKELESALLMECRDQGRYVDFGKRSIMNYGKVSLLVKNMPMNDSKKYGAIKDNVFSLLQGAHARIEALDNIYTMQLESKVVMQLAESMRGLMRTVDDSYQHVMQDIAGVVETMAAGVEHTVQFLGMDEYQEKSIQEIMETGISETTRVFNQGVRIDNGLTQLLEKIDSVMSSEHGDTRELNQLLELLEETTGKSMA